MMCSTASVQVNVEAGLSAPGRTGPSATIAPPLGSAARHRARAGGRVRQLPPSCRPADRMEEHPAGGVGDAGPGQDAAPRRPRPGEDIADTWARCSLDAPVMIIRRDRGPWTAPAGLTFREWIRHGRAAVPDRPPPTIDDLAYHLTTLFPPVRPRGHLEVRYVDAQPGPWWTVPPAVITALLDDDAAGAAGAGDHPPDARALARRGPARHVRTRCWPRPPSGCSSSPRPCWPANRGTGDSPGRSRDTSNDGRPGQEPRRRRDRTTQLTGRQTELDDGLSWTTD